MRYKLPETINTWDLTLGGASLKMRHDELTLPKVTFGEKEFSAAGLSSKLNLPNGQKELGEISLSVIGKATDLLQARHICKVDGATLVFTGKNKRGGCGATSSTTQIIMRGRLAEFDPGSLKQGEDNKTTMLFKPVSVRVKEDSKEVYAIDLTRPEKDHIKGQSI